MALTKLVYCVRKRAELSDEEFRSYWLERHGPLVRSLWEAGRFPGMVKYVQSHTIVDASESVSARCGQPPYDGITEVWMDPARQGTGDDAGRAAAAEAGRKLLEDESKFIDFDNSSVFVTTEHVIFD